MDAGSIPARSTRGALAQLGARHIRIVEARGSTPLCSMQKRVFMIQHKYAFFFMLYPGAEISLKILLSRPARCNNIPVRIHIRMNAPVLCLNPFHNGFEPEFLRKIHNLSHDHDLPSAVRIRTL